MKTHKKRIGLVIYANPDNYPPVINAIHILAKEFDLVIICRNQNKLPQIEYPKNAKLYRLGKLKTAREKEGQGLMIKVLEYLFFTICTIFYIRFYSCQLIYSYDMHGFITGFLARHLGKRIPLIYHNLDLAELQIQEGLSYVIKFLELHLARYANRVVFPDINRAEFFQRKANLTKLPDIVMNTPLRINQLPLTNRLKETLEAEGFSTDTKVILYHGAINEGHCILEIIKSMVLWSKNIVLVLIGELSKDFLDNIHNIARSLNLNNHIIHIPKVSYSGLLSYTIGAYLGLALYKPIDINQTFNAGASNKIFEYLSLGIPVITNDSPYFRRILDSSIAYFVKPDSGEDIAKAVNSLVYNEEEYHRKSQAARLSHLTRFNYEEQFKPIMEYIREAT